MTPDRKSELRYIADTDLPPGIDVQAALNEALDEIERLRRDLQQKEEAVEHWIQRACANEADANELADRLRRLQRERDALLRQHEAVEGKVCRGDPEYWDALNEAHEEAARVLAEGKVKA